MISIDIPKEIFNCKVQWKRVTEQERKDSSRVLNFIPQMSSLWGLRHWKNFCLQRFHEKINEEERTNLGKKIKLISYDDIGNCLNHEAIQTWQDRWDCKEWFQSIIVEKYSIVRYLEELHELEVWPRQMTKKGWFSGSNLPCVVLQYWH